MVDFGFTKSSLGLTDEDVKKAESGGNGNKFMEPGVHSVKIAKAEYFGGKAGKIQSDSDPTWVKLKIEYENSAQQKTNQIILVPTSKLTYRTKQGKEIAFLFVKFKEFCEGFGEIVSADPASLNKVTTKFFKDPSKLVGKGMEITLEYTGPYLQYVGKDGDNAQYSIMSKDGQILDAGPYTKEEAQIAAAKKSLTLVGFTEIVHITSKVSDAPKKEAAVSEEGW